MTINININERINADRKYVCESDLANGDELVVLIEDVVEEQVFNPGTKQSDAQIILYFKGNPVKPLVLGSKTNMRAIRKATGERMSKEWVGKKIQLYRAREPRSETGYAVRIRDFAPGE